MSFSASPSLPPSPHPAPIPLSSSCVTCCPELDLSVTLSPAPKTYHTQQMHRLQRKSLQNDQTHLKPAQQGQIGRRRNPKVCFEEPVTVIVTPEPQLVPARQPVRSLRKNRDRRYAGRRSVEPPAATFLPDPGCLERAELNTTLALKAELHSLQGAEFNSQKALQETLQKSERTKNLINARATEVVNVSRSQLLFNSLVSVSVQEDLLISQVLQDRLLLAPPPPPPRCQDTKAAEGPSLLFFMTSDLFRQKPLSQEEEPGTLKPLLMLRPAFSTFDLYRQQRCWEATP
ncbi:protein phosphatase 1 regulatory subunit 35 [Kryptolebias marmoratus]|uniref:Protein phosphatase 1 regulatory subunit 35-like n=1 Tax=Kryptolebias marmoratus TaxID=37003 RepID=A0A3Q3F0X4_KRYMA|nr:protein phosphatase 1 regulatory subunit 35 [Kryptolebias marmoratus]XP_024858046.1 protein phosphatase 1 regulatory subunit 35 [Kryptolebias marmoratus]